MVSFVLPIYNERENLRELFAEIAAACDRRPYEIIAVDDGSTDGSWEELQLLAADSHVLVAALRRNAGQTAALAAGCDLARGDIVVTLDADGQNDPVDAGRLVDMLGGDASLAAVVGVRVNRRDPWWKLVQSRIANAARNWITGDRVQDTGCGLKAVRREVLLRLPRFDGMHRFLPTLIRIQGGRVAEVPVAHRPRRHCRSKYGMWNRVFRAVRDAFGVRWLAGRRLRYEVRDVIPRDSREAGSGKREA